ncbi:MAG: serine/threonine protein kinase [Planctomycetaceae bacterium]|nr:serine/threonine protein kinase [Planctomycetaceae bacterium]
MPLFDHLKTILGGGQLNVSKRFVLLHEAISGTMSSFYMARDLRTGQIVGLKLLDPQKTTAFESRFKGLKKPSEGSIAAQLKHPNIVETLESGKTTEGAPYVVMEYLEGPNMNAALAARDPCLEGRRVHFIRQAAEAIAAVHEAGFIHRDVCPRNFMLTNNRQDLKLIDFGLAVPATRWFMQPGNRTGTPNYMAPELVRRRETDQRLDVFAFGVTAYEICTFELPWTRGSTGMAAMSHNQPPVDIRKYRPELAPALARAIHSCIEPELPKRCPSINDFLRLIRKVQD